MVRIGLRTGPIALTVIGVGRGGGVVPELKVHEHRLARIDDAVVIARRPRSLAAAPRRALAEPHGAETCVHIVPLPLVYSANFCSHTLRALVERRGDRHHRRRICGSPGRVTSTKATRKSCGDVDGAGRALTLGRDDLVDRDVLARALGS